MMHVAFKHNYTLRCQTSPDAKLHCSPSLRVAAITLGELLTAIMAVSSSAVARWACIEVRWIYFNTSHAGSERGDQEAHIPPLGHNWTDLFCPTAFSS